MDVTPNHPRIHPRTPNAPIRSGTQEANTSSVDPRVLFDDCLFETIGFGDIRRTWESGIGDDLEVRTMYEPSSEYLSECETIGMEELNTGYFFDDVRSLPSDGDLGYDSGESMVL